MLRYRILIALGALGVMVGGCHGDFLTGGELSTNPNAPTSATESQLFAGIETSIWALLGSNPTRVTSIFVQQFTGAQSQYQSLNDNYKIDENTTNGMQQAIYAAGGLVDIRKLEDAALASHDSVFLGIARVQEAITMGTGADMFGDLVYSEALQNIRNPKVDPQLSVYDSVQKALSAAIVDLAASGPTNVGPGPNDLVYGGDPAAWSTLAHTLKARFYMHTAEVRPQAYAQALAEAQQGITSDAGDYFGAFTGNSGEQNFYYQFEFTAGRAGYMVPGRTLDTLLRSRNDPRRTQYFQIDPATDSAVQISAARLANPAYPQVYVSYDENTLIWAEAAYRTGDEVTALAKLNEERANNGLPAENVSGRALLNEILLEKYIADFQLGIEAWNDYKRTCTPNIVPPTTAANSITGGKVPARFFYDTPEIATNSNLAPAKTGNNGLRNANDPPNAVSDGTGAPCLGQ